MLSSCAVQGYAVLLEYPVQSVHPWDAGPSLRPHDFEALERSALLSRAAEDLRSLNERRGFGAVFE